MVAWVTGPMHGTATDLGLVNGCFAVALLMSGFCVKFLPKRLHPRFYVFGGCIIMGMCAVLVGVYPNPWYTMVIAFVFSFALGIINATVSGMFMEAIPAHLRARVGGASNVLDRLAIPVGLAVFGFLIAFLPLPWVFAIIGLFVILSGLPFIPNIVRMTPEAPVRSRQIN
jgi:DHA3 family macrolide efflux protein-like MFS transporter